MKVFKASLLIQFAGKHPELRTRLETWRHSMQQCNAGNLHELRRFFQQADYIPDGWTVFNVGGGVCRVVAAIDYTSQRVFIRSVFTHSEYDRWTRRNRRK